MHAPAEAPSRFVAAYSPDEADRAITDLSDVYEFHWIPNTVQIGPFQLHAVSAQHPCEAYSFRIEYGGRSLVYTGDTGPSAKLDSLAAGADVVLSEASWTHTADRPPDLHMSGTQAGQLAETAGAGRLLLTHVPPWTDAAAVLAEARAEFTGDVTPVRKGKIYDI